MTDPFAHGTPVGDFHMWVKPEPAPCPDCPCRSARLCEAGREHVMGCGGAANTSDWETVRDCPCSPGAEQEEES